MVLAGYACGWAVWFVRQWLANIARGSTGAEEEIKLD